MAVHSAPSYTPNANVGIPYKSQITLVFPSSPAPAAIYNGTKWSSLGCEARNSACLVRSYRAFLRCSAWSELESGSPWTLKRRKNTYISHVDRGVNRTIKSLVGFSRSCWRERSSVSQIMSCQSPRQHKNALFPIRKKCQKLCNFIMDLPTGVAPLPCPKPNFSRDSYSRQWTLEQWVCL